MSRKSGGLARFLFASMAIGLVPAPSSAQPAWNLNRVVRVFQNQSGDSVVLETRSQKPISAPSIKYLPGANGETMMVADFFGVSSTLPPQVIRPAVHNGSPASISQIRVGQFQESPPILRVAISARDTAALRSLSFGSHAGSLVVKWSTPKTERRPTSDFAAPAKTLAVNSGSSPVEQGLVATAASLSQQEEVVIPEKAASGQVRSSLRASKAVAPLRGELPLDSPLSLRVPKAAPQREASLGDTNVKQAPDAVVSEAPSRSLSAKSGTSASANLSANLKSAAGKASSSAAKVSSARLPAPAPERTSKNEERQSRGASVAHSDAKGEAEASSSKERHGLLSRLFNHAHEKATENAGHQSDSQAQNQSGSPASFDELYATARTPKPAPEIKSSSSKGASSARARNGVADAPFAYQPAQLDAVRRANHIGAGLAGSSETEPATISVLPGLDNETSSQHSLNITVASGNRLRFKSFRMHEPERYVVDFSDAPEIAEAVVPEVAENRLVRAVRVGSPEEHSSRLVIDLADPEAIVAEHLNPTATAITFSIAKTDSRPDSEMPTAEKPLAGEVIVVDAGHGGSDPGAQRGTIQEKQITLDIAEKLKAKLAAEGARVIMTRDDDSFVSLEDRVRLTNSIRPGLFVSVHINALESTSDIHGIETYFQTEQSKPLADAIHKSLVGDLDAPDRSVRQARFFVINHTPVPAILAEVGFISNREEREKLISSDYQTKVAAALAQGVTLYVSKNPVKPGSTATSRHVPYQQSGNTIDRGTPLSQNRSLKSKLAESTDESSEAVR